MLHFIRVQANKLCLYQTSSRPSSLHLIFCINIDQLIRLVSTPSNYHWLIGLFVQILPLSLSKCQIYIGYVVDCSIPIDIGQYRYVGLLADWIFDHQFIYLISYMIKLTGMSSTRSIGPALAISRSLRSSYVTTKFHVNI